MTDLSASTGSNAEKVWSVQISYPYPSIVIINNIQKLYRLRRYMYIIHAGNTNRIPTEVKPRFVWWFVFPVQNKEWHVLYLCRSCVETSPHTTHPCLTRAQICISQPGYTGACTRVLSQHWLSVTVPVVPVVPTGTCLGMGAIWN